MNARNLRRWDTVEAERELNKFISSSEVHRLVQQILSEPNIACTPLDINAQELYLLVCRLLKLRAHRGQITDDTCLRSAVRDLTVGLARHHQAAPSSQKTDRLIRRGRIFAELSDEDKERRREILQLCMVIPNIADARYRRIAELALEGKSVRQIAADKTIGLGHAQVGAIMKKLRSELAEDCAGFTLEELGTTAALLLTLGRLTSASGGSSSALDDERQQSNDDSRGSIVSLLGWRTWLAAVLPVVGVVAWLNHTQVKAPDPLPYPPTSHGVLLAQPGPAPENISDRDSSLLDAHEVEVQSTGAAPSRQTAPIEGIGPAPEPPPSAPTVEPDKSTSGGPPIFTLSSTKVTVPTMYPEYPGVIAVPSDPPGGLSSYWLPITFCSKYPGLRICMGRQILKCGNDGIPESFVDCSGRCVGQNDNPTDDPVCVAEGDPRAGAPLCSDLEDGRYRYYQIFVICESRTARGWSISDSSDWPLRGRYPADSPPRPL